MKAMVTGAAGQLGRAVLGTAPADVEAAGFDRGMLDIADAAGVCAALRREKPQVLINAAAYTAVDRAESELESARRVNAEGPRTLAEACRTEGVRLVHISTDFVFGGDSPQPLATDAATDPKSVYGRTKLEGERAVAETLEGVLIVRTAWVCSAHGRNFLNTMIRLMRERGEVRVVSDQYGTPTFVDGLARAIWGLIAAGATGVQHWTNAGSASWYDFAEAIRREAQSRDLLGTGARVVPISTEEFPTPARRPRFSVLDCSQAYRMLGEAASHWQDALGWTIAEIADA